MKDHVHFTIIGCRLYTTITYAYIHHPDRIIHQLKSASSLARLVALHTRRLQQRQRITNLAIIAADVLPLQGSGADDSQLAEAEVLVVEDGGDVLLALTGAELAVALDVAGGTVDEVSHGLAGVGAVGVVVDDGGSVDGTVGAEGEETLVPVDMTVDWLE